MVTRRGWERGPVPCCERKRPAAGRPQGSHPLILTAPALTKTRNSQLSLRSLCKGWCGVERRGDPSPFVLTECEALDARASLARRVGASGRPGVGLWRLNLTLIGRP